jgi:hypothetical protein
MEASGSSPAPILIRPPLYGDPNDSSDDEIGTVFEDDPLENKQVEQVEDKIQGDVEHIEKPGDKEN